MMMVRVHTVTQLKMRRRNFTLSINFRTIFYLLFHIVLWQNRGTAGPSPGTCGYLLIKGSSKVYPILSVLVLGSKLFPDA